MEIEGMENEELHASEAVEDSVSKKEDLSKHQTLLMKYCASTICTNANACRKAGEFCDTIIKVAGIEYPAHKMILSRFSACLNAMLLGNFTESLPPIPTISLNDVDGSVMDILLDYIYTGEIEITKSNAQSLLEAAHFLMASPLFDLCCYSLEQMLNAGNCLSIQHIGNLYSCITLRDKATTFVLENFAEVVEEDEFLELDENRLKDLISNDSLKVDKEEIVFEAVLVWMYHRREERLERFAEVLRQVRLAYIDSHFLNDRIMEETALLNSPSCMRLVEHVNKYRLFESRQSDLQSSFSRRRNNSPYTEALVLHFKMDVDKRPALSEDGRILYITGDYVETWYHVSSYKAILSESSRDSLDWFLFCSGERISDGDVPVFDQIEKFTNYRSLAAWSELDDCWYAIGGLGNGPKTFPSKCVDRFNVKQGKWESVAPLPEAVYGAAAVSSGGLIFVLGGYLNSLTPSTEMQIYSPLLDLWTRDVVPIPFLYEPSACALNKCFYVFSKHPKKSVYFYNTSSAAWGRCADMEHGFLSGPVIMNGRIFVLTEKEGGERFIERYSPEEDSWKTFATFPELSPISLQGPLLFLRDKEADVPEGIRILML